MTWSDRNQSPSSRGDENVLTYGNVTATIKDGLCEVVVGAATLKLTSAAVTIKVGGVNVEVSDAGVAITGGKVRGQVNTERSGSAFFARGIQTVTLQSRLISGRCEQRAAGRGRRWLERPP